MLPHIPYLCYITPISCYRSRIDVTQPPFGVIHPVLMLHNVLRSYTDTFAVTQSVLLLHKHICCYTVRIAVTQPPFQQAVDLCFWSERGVNYYCNINDTASCVAGAVCTNFRCLCDSQVAVPLGAICGRHCLSLAPSTRLSHPSSSHKFQKYVG